jgi:hypothetical protein
MESNAKPNDWPSQRQFYGRPLSVRGAVADEQLAALFPQPVKLWGAQRESQSGPILAWGGRTLYLGDLATGRGDAKARLIWTASLPAPIDRAHFAPRQQLVIAACDDGFYILDAHSGRLQKERMGRSGLKGLSLSADGKRMLEWGGAGAGLNSESGGYVVSWNLETLTPDSPVLRHVQLVDSAEYSDDQSYIASSTGYVNQSGTTTVHVWSRELGVEVTPPLNRTANTRSKARFLAGRHELVVWTPAYDSRGVRWNWGEATRDLPETGLVLEVARRTGSRLNRFQDFEFLSRAEWEALR